MKNLRKILALMLALAMAVSLFACSSGNVDQTNPPEETNSPEATDPPEGEPSDEGNEPGGDMADSITLWTYPIGDWGKEDVVKGLTDAFTEATGIKVTVEYLDYTAGDDRVNGAITAKGTPDLIMEGPERLVANWGANGYLVDLSDMFDSGDMDEINAVNDGIMKACTHTNGAIYEYPLVMTAHCMAINKTAFEQADALQYVDLENHTWTTENFIKAIQAVYDEFGDTVGAVFCNNQGGDQGTRALVNNLYGGTFTNAEHTQYTWDDPKNIQALEQLYNMDGIEYDASIVGGDEIAKFYQGVLKVAFCWNIAQQLNPNGAGDETGPEKTISGEDIAFMSFPSETGESKLQGGIWGFGIFNNGDDARIAAAKEFIKFMCDSEHTVDAVKAAKYFAVRTTAGGADLSNVWADEPIMAEYTKLMPYLGDYYQVTTGWAQARTEWWNMLQEVGGGADAAEAVAAHVAAANEAAAG